MAQINSNPQTFLSYTQSQPMSASLSISDSSYEPAEALETENELESLVAELKDACADVGNFFFKLDRVARIQESIATKCRSIGDQISQQVSSTANALYEEQIVSQFSPKEKGIIGLGISFNSWLETYTLEDLMIFLVSTPELPAGFTLRAESTYLLAQNERILLEFSYQDEKFAVLFQEPGIDWNQVTKELKGASILDFLANAEQWPHKVLKGFGDFVQRQILSFKPSLIENKRLGVTNLKLSNRPKTKVDTHSPDGSIRSTYYVPVCASSVRSSDSLSLRLDWENQSEWAIVEQCLDLIPSQVANISEKVEELALSRKRNLIKIADDYVHVPWKVDLWEVLTSEGYLGSKSLPAMAKRWEIECDRLERINRKRKEKGLATEEINRNPESKTLIAWFNSQLAVELDLFVTSYDWQLLQAKYKLSPKQLKAFENNVASYAQRQYEHETRPLNLALNKEAAPVWKVDLYTEMDSLFMESEYKAKYNPNKLLRTAKVTYTEEDITKMKGDLANEIKAEIQAQFDVEKQQQLVVTIEQQSKEIATQKQQIEDLSAKMERLLQEVAQLREENQKMSAHQEVVAEKASTNGHSDLVPVEVV